MTWWASVLGLPETDWRADFARAAADLGVAIDAGDEPLVWVNERLYAVGRFVDAANADAARRRRSPCPYFTAPPVGVIEWTELDPGARNDWVRAWMRHGRGLIGRGPVVRSAAALHALPLRGLTSKWGFDDGDCFLTRDGDALDGYATALRNTFQTALDEADLEGAVGWLEATCHNPLRVYGHRQSIGSTAALARLSARAWVWDESLLTDRELFPTSG